MFGVVSQNTMARFARDEIYSFVGSVLLAINPYKLIPNLYTEEQMQVLRLPAPAHARRTLPMAPLRSRRCTRPSPLWRWTLTSSLWSSARTEEFSTTLLTRRALPIVQRAQSGSEWSCCSRRPAARALAESHSLGRERCWQDRDD